MKIVVGFSGGVTSAWCAGWALRNFKKGDVVLLNHDTKEEHPDTYRFNREMSAALGVQITERSDGRSVTELFHDEGALANNRMAFCSRILKAEQGERFVRELKEAGETDVTKVFGYTRDEEERVQRAYAFAEKNGYKVRFPLVEDRVTKQQAADWCLSLGVKPSEMYRWSGHANCIGCVRGGKAYWLAVALNAPAVFAQRVALEKEFGHTFLVDESLEALAKRGLKTDLFGKTCPTIPTRVESIEIGPCECGG